MGIWGPGNFDNDAARDHLFDLTRELAEQIERSLDVATARRLEQASDADVRESLGTMLPNVEIICVLHETLGGGFLPEPAVADDWQTRFEQLGGWALFAAEYPDRQRVVRETFTKLRQLADQCWSD